ncbi:MAG: SH3 domain-containing protein [Chloroflexi bacterium]|nr:SH3 domain-containing protein [Chloroflexota bacterium]
MTTGEPNLRREEAARPENGKTFRPRSFSAPPPDPAEALYYEGMAAYQHRNWEQALERFSRLKELQSNRPGLDALLDEVRWFLQLQAAAPARREPVEEPRGETSRRGWRNWALAGLALVGIVALVIIALGGRFPWVAASGREAQDLYNRGQARLAVGDYEGAQAAFKNLLEIAPNDPEGLQGLSRAERQQTLAQGYAAAEAAIAVDDWDTAGAELTKVLALDPSYRDAQAKADFVAQRRRLAALYADGSRLYDLNRWEDAAAQFARIQELDNAYRKEAVDEFLFVCYLNAGQELIDTADAKIVSVQRAIEYFSSALAIHPRNRRATDERRLAVLYLDAVRGLANNNLPEAQARLEALLAETSTYANGQAARQLYALLLNRAEAAVQAGDAPAAVRFYQGAQAVAVSDHTAAVQGEAIARAITPTPLPRPTATPRPTALFATPTPFAVARSDALNVRSGPSTAYPIVGVIRAGDPVAITGRNADGSWLQVCCVALADGGAASAQPPLGTETGWISAGLAEVQGSLDLLAVVTPPALPVTAVETRPAPTGSQVICLVGRVRDTGSGSLAGWTITLQGPSGPAQTQRTDGNGAYRFDALAAGAYTVGETLEPGWRTVSPQSSAVTLTPAGACVTVDFWNERGDGRSSTEPVPTRPEPTAVPTPRPTPPR